MRIPSRRSTGFRGREFNVLSRFAMDDGLGVHGERDMVVVESFWWNEIEDPVVAVEVPFSGCVELFQHVDGEVSMGPFVVQFAETVACGELDRFLPRY